MWSSYFGCSSKSVEKWTHGDLSVSCRGVRIAKTDRAKQGTFQELAMILRNRKPKEKNREAKESNSQIREMIQFRWRATLALQKWVPWAHSTYIHEFGRGILMSRL
jgi:hypothetical protein